MDEIVGGTNWLEVTDWVTAGGLDEEPPVASPLDAQAAGSTIARPRTSVRCSTGMKPSRTGLREASTDHLVGIGNSLDSLQNPDRIIDGYCY